MDAQASGPRTIRTMCPMNCHPTLCGMLVTVEDGRLLEVRGDPDNPDSRGFLCVRGRASREIIDNPRRLLRPLVRARRGEDAWQRVSWDDALGLVADRMRAAGREAVGLWSGHGLFANNYGTRVGSHLLRRFANLWGCQWWHPSMICWGLGGFGLGLTGVLEANTKEDMAEHARLVLLWGANLASQPNTAPHLVAARRRGARVITIDVRETEAWAQSDETILIRPGTDAALALAMMSVHHRGRAPRRGVRRAPHGRVRRAGGPRAAARARVGCADHRGAGGPHRGARAPVRGDASRDDPRSAGARCTRAGTAGRRPARSRACRRSTGNLGMPGGGLGPRHGAASHGQALSDITEPERRPPGAYVPNQMPRVIDALVDRRVRALLLFGTDMLSSFADAGRVATGLGRSDLVVSHDLFLNDTARQFADVVLPGTSWLEELGCKSTNTHLYLMPKVLEAPGEARPAVWILRELARRLGDRRSSTPGPPTRARSTRSSIIRRRAARRWPPSAPRAGSARCESRTSGIPPTPTRRLPARSSSTRSGRPRSGLPPLPVHEPAPAPSRIRWRSGRGAR